MSSLEQSSLDSREYVTPSLEINGTDTAQSQNDPLHRTIDDFLEELYTEYKSKFNDHNENEFHSIDGTASNWRALEAERASSPTQTLFECVLNFFLRFIRQIYRFCYKGNKGSFNDAARFQYRKYLPLPLLALCIANSSDATEILMLSYLLANPTFRRDMFTNNGDGGDASDMEGAEYLASSIFLGMLLGGTVLGFWSDSIGRRPALLIGLLMNAIAGTLSSVPFLTPSFVELTVLRFIAGIGIGATVPPLFSLASEWSPKESRGSVVTAVASFWMVGSLFVSGVGWCLFHDSDEAPDHGGSGAVWRIFAALCALPSALGAFMVYRYVPESPRFLATNHDYSQAARSCNQMALTLGVSFSTTGQGVYSLEKPSSRPNATTTSLHPLTAEDLDRSNAMISTTEQQTKTTTSQYSKLTETIHIFHGTLRKLYSRQLRSQTTLPLQILWFALSFGSYGITTWINSLFVAVHLQNLYLNSFLFALATLPGNIISVFYSDQWGRKKMLVSSLIGAAGSLIGFAVLVSFGSNHEQDDGSWLRTDAIVLFACLFQMCSIVSWNSVDILSGESFPTRVRSAGMGVCTASGRLGAMVAQIANAKLMMSRSGTENGSETVASAWVLVVASSALLLGAGMPAFLGKELSGAELKDDVADGVKSDTSSSILGCGSVCKAHKEHLSDEENDAVNCMPMSSKKDALQIVRGLNEYDSFRHEVEANEPFLL